METPSWIVLALAWLVSLILLKKLITPRHRKPKYPPGPKPWPIIGNLNLVGSIPHQSFHKLSKIYGEIMQLKFGSFPVVVVSSTEMAKQILQIHGETFASRPVTAASKYISYNFSDMLWAPYGPYWRQARRIYLNELFSHKRLDSYEYIRVEERHALVSRLFSLSGDKIAVKEHIVHFALTNMSRMTLGDKYFSESQSESSSKVKFEELKEMVDEWFLLNGVSNIGDWIPWLSFLDLQGYVKRMKALFKKLDRFHDHVIGDHKARREVQKGLGAKDMVEIVLQLADDPNLEVNINSDCVKGLLQDPILGGTDTLASTVEWAISELLKQPHLLRKATQDLDTVVGREKWVGESDMQNLPFIDAIVKETMRLHPAATLLAPHFSTHDCKIAGYDIPKGTIVFVNVWSIGRDPRYWDEPNKFLPERFLGSEIDVKGHNFELLPFGSGRRMCPAYRLGMKMIGSTLANLLHGFNWKLPENVKPEDVDMDEQYAFTTHRANPIIAVIEPRLPSHLYC
ncbi:trimethyltridecatetraene synthase-like [Actinidia eriantha]|uniref:trimethyltridecatetraene synthase-like n=1 Tax=Actinidia eriantha TaxID=165200 RepID=UPI002587EBBA|nr:trimethyltridecatetraene synthase-like [Actinidia eriantha]